MTPLDLQAFPHTNTNVSFYCNLEVNRGVKWGGLLTTSPRRASGSKAPSAMGKGRPAQDGLRWPAQSSATAATQPRRARGKLSSTLWGSPGPRPLAIPKFPRPRETGTGPRLAKGCWGGSAAAHPGPPAQKGDSPEPQHAQSSCWTCPPPQGLRLSHPGQTPSPPSKGLKAGLTGNLTKTTSPSPTWGRRPPRLTHPLRQDKKAEATARLSSPWTLPLPGATRRQGQAKARPPSTARLDIKVQKPLTQHPGSTGTTCSPALQGCSGQTGATRPGPRRSPASLQWSDSQPQPQQPLPEAPQGSRCKLSPRQAQGLPRLAVGAHQPSRGLNQPGGEPLPRAGRRVAQPRPWARGERATLPAIKHPPPSQKGVNTGVFN